MSAKPKMWRRWLPLLALILMAAIFAGAYEFASWKQLTGEICTKDAHTEQEQCTAYNPVLVWLWQVGERLNYYAPVLTILATLAIAYFTLTLKRATDRLWGAAEKDLAAFNRSLTQQRKIADEQIIKMDAHVGEAGRAADEIANAANAMKALTTTSKETAERQLRAYLCKRFGADTLRHMKSL